ncbi:hypothetical protein P4S63_01605, partial [Pseudoalteromonas sp. B193]
SAIKLSQTKSNNYDNIKLHNKQRTGYFVDANLHQFIEEQLCAKTNTTETYQALATLADRVWL